MSITLELPTNIESQVLSIPDLDLRLQMFLRHEAQLEQLRRVRFSDQARDIAARAMRDSAADQEEGFSWDESFEKLRQAQEAINMKI